VRDYIVLWKVLGLDSVTRWTANFGGDVTFTNPDIPPNQAEKVYVRVPNEQLLLDAFNRDAGDLTSQAMIIDSNTFTFHEGWSRLFGGNTPGGYARLSDVPTSDAFGALHGRPARDSTGKFIVNPY
jgi:hypothetical protein